MKIFFPSALLSLLSIIATAQPCSDLFISEYVEGGSNNKAIEIYNPTANAVDLTGYKIQLYTNGSATPTATLTLAGTVAAGDVYVVVNSQANASIKATRDTSSGVTNFNGNDAVVLINGTTVIDVIGQIGTDPGTEWTVGSGSTLNHTLVRMASVQEGSDNWAINAQQWDVLPQDSIQLGAHSMTSCAAPTDTTVRFLPLSATVAETAGTYNMQLVLNQAASTDKTVAIELRVGDAADIGNFTTTTVTISANSTTASYSVTITDDVLAEASEELQFVLRNPSAGLLLAADSVFRLTITDDDSAAPHYPIAIVTTVNATGVADSAGVKCSVSGVVYGINLRNNGLQFFMHDGTGGMGVFSSTKNFGYTVQEGDSVFVSGEVGQFEGFTQMQTLDTVYKIGTGILMQPTNTTVLDESTEAELVRINNLTLVNPSQWSNSNPNGFTVNVTNGSQTFELRIDEQVDLFNQSAPTSPFDVIGLGSQFDNTSPYDGGYQILPRYNADLLLRTAIENQQISMLAIYPNPTDGLFRAIIENKHEQPERVRVTDVAGKVVFESPSVSPEVALIDLTGVAPGLYFVTLFSEKSLAVGKVQVASVK